MRGDLKRNAVVESVSGEKATVSFLREEACAGCAGRRLCMNSKNTSAEVRNLIGARVGDTVEIETETSSVLLYCLILFLAPVLLALVMYLVFMNVNTVLAYVLTVVGFILPYPFAAVLNRKTLLPIITKIIE